MPTTLTLKLKSNAYSQFLTEFRKADRDQSAGHETQVTYTDDEGASHTYFFRSKNFSLIAYAHNGARITLTDYNHVSSPGSAGLNDFIGSLKRGGSGGTNMNADLTRVVTLTSEAARSKLVERLMREVISDGKTADLNKLEVVFKDYNHVAKRCGRLDVNGQYTPNWRPLEKDDYLIYFRGLGAATSGARDASIVNEL
ncbi:hypothetical protein J8I87_11435 [Paraburkholderia sp. LEh10]|uniref:hypothetical protein n=1 Tax=Paraburkholderia sp. LEh10 TaxID=2821353 RepID=UPI001AE9C62D|nr:hypothetical protein [Paraburkholderia sp. LEh10]MBP0590312.1 hypothetical protein [Paraburkholderia sp. LEh10]